MFQKTFKGLPHIKMITRRLGKKAADVFLEEEEAGYRRYQHKLACAGIKVAGTNEDIII